MASFCAKCGAPATPGVRFCSQCGAPLEAAAPPAAGPAPSPNSSPAPPPYAPAPGGFGSSSGSFPASQSKSGLGTLMWILLGIVLALFIAFGSCAYYVVHKAREVASRVKIELPNVRKEIEEKGRDVQRQLEEKSREVARASDVCALVTADELETIYGTPFLPGERHGQSCVYSKSSPAGPAVTVLLDHSAMRFDQEVKRRNIQVIDHIGEARAFYSSSNTMFMEYRWNFVMVTAPGGREKCEEVARVLMGRL